MAQISKSQPMRPAEIELVEQVNDNTTDIATLTAGLANEITDRTNADTTLQNNIDAEATTRADADTALTNSLNAEVTARQELGTTVEELGTQLNQTNTNLTTEVTNRTDADTTLQGNIDAVAGNLTTETTNRETADTALDGRITTLDGKFPVANADLATNAVKEGNIADEQVTTSKLSAGIQSQLSFLASVPTIQYGTSNSVDVAGNSSADVTVSFGTTKTESPVVICGLQHSSGNLTCVVTQVTNLEFAARIFNLSNTDVTDVTLDYIALSGR